MKILFIGDIVGRGGRDTVKKVLPGIRKEEGIDLVIANAENSAAGFGVTGTVYHQLTDDMGIDVLTSGNHIWDKREMVENIDSYPRLLRPINYPPTSKGTGHYMFEYKGKTCCVISVMGRIFMPPIDCPFQTIDKLLDEIDADMVFVDMHAEATSEKKALAWHLSGRVSAVVGTHTHVQTADERILDDHTAYISDVGLVGGMDSVLGMGKKEVLGRFTTSIPSRFQVVTNGTMEFNSVVIELDEETGKALSIKRIHKEIDL